MVTPALGAVDDLCRDGSQLVVLPFFTLMRKDLGFIDNLCRGGGRSRLQRGELHALCEATTYHRHTGLNYHRSAKDCRFRCWSDTAPTGRK
ncbi:hypothetical protein [Nonomuraea sp. NPDC049480]|uniref:hypothetical protein n=1 Tax=Nonomuraea sp. NPDC049480 TaxID=3364353 RepID=UPI00379BDA4A